MEDDDRFVYPLCRMPVSMGVVGQGKVRRRRAGLLTSAVPPPWPRPPNLQTALRQAFAQSEDVVSWSVHHHALLSSEVLLGHVNGLFECPHWPGGVHPRPGTVLEAANNVVLSSSALSIASA